MIIIKYREWLKIQPTLRTTIYELCKDDFKKVRILSKEEAIDMIENNGLTKVHSNKYGAIWR
jgi:hypothetical protein